MVVMASLMPFFDTNKTELNGNNWSKIHVDTVCGLLYIINNIFPNFTFLDMKIWSA